MNHVERRDEGLQDKERQLPPQPLLYPCVWGPPLSGAVALASAQSLAMERLQKAEKELRRINILWRAHIHDLVLTQVAEDRAQLRAVALQIATSGAWWPQPPEALRLQVLCRGCHAWANERVQYSINDALARGQAAGLL